MSIEVCAYSQIYPMSVSKIDEEANQERIIYLNEPEVAHNPYCAGLVLNTHYRFGTSHGFFMGGNEDFSSWKKILCKLAFNCTLHQYYCSLEKSLQEILSSNSQETILDSEACLKAWKELETYAAKAMTINLSCINEEIWFIERYKNWLRALELGANNGCLVIF